MAHKNILVAVLDWGLGHAARTIPIIRKLQERKLHVIIASSGYALQMLRLEFPQNIIIELPAYNPIYHHHTSMSWNMAIQTPHFLKTIYEEHQLLKKIVGQYRIAAVISDNRYGLFHQQIPSVLITHQLYIQTPVYLSWLKPVLRQINFQFINRFNYCWIPDSNQHENLSGMLTREKKLPAHARFIGWLSRFKKIELPLQYDLMLLLSGPEPQRSILEKKLLKQSQQLSISTLLVRGVFNKPVLNGAPHITIKNFLSGTELENALNQSGIVVARSGYSTAMDLIHTGNKGIFIPTPGQTEQEYLAGYWKMKKWFYAEAQSDFDLKRALSYAESFFPKINIQNHTQLFDKALDELIENI
jgi:hypothetical protein